MTGECEEIYIYICHNSAFNLFEDIFLKIELPERSDACVRDVAHMPVQYHHTSVTFCHICHRLVSTIEHGCAKRPGKCHAERSVLYTHCEYPSMAWKFNIGGVFLCCNYSIFFEAELSP